MTAPDTISLPESAGNPEAPATGGFHRPSSLLRNTGWSAIATVALLASRFVTNIAVARLLGPKGTGVVAYDLWLVEIGTALAGLGLNSTATRFVADLHGQARPGEAQAIARWLHRRYCAITGFSAIFLVLIQPVFGHKITPHSTAIGLYFSLQALSIFYLAYLAGGQQFHQIARLNALSGLLLVVATAIGGHFGGAFGVLLGYAASALPGASLSLALLYGTKPDVRPDRKLRRRCARYAVSTWIATLLSMLVWSRVEIAFLQRYWASESIAMFTVGLTLASLATQGPLLLTGPLLPHFAQRVGEQDRKGIVSVYGSGTLLLAATLFPLCTGLASITPIVLPLLYGNAFRAAVPTAMVLIAFSALSFANVGSALLYARERSGFIALSGALGAVLSIASGFIIVPRWGPWGAAWSRAFVQTSMIALGTWYISKRLACPVPFRAIGKVLGAALAAAGISYAIGRVIADVRGVLLAVPAAAISYLVCIKYERVFREADLAMALRVADRLPRRMGQGLSTGLTWLSGHDESIGGRL